ncbi:lipid IV(A) 3-deoxy-D-manno-octulosonic acid transferase [Candidatus Williamhamiltonella defendens]|uniref:3-deoxy-D-manno-octulosonic acid transferase n=1 Tax=Candidatus Hamiltonella defensa (Bemisia tabaci) TaxID=672795 RepID=A0A249DZY0_9ENTR|nr:lipid IV(A) 3-deoxy-D-manno-octulosonic acid transferase [Candidatus Hamiltonella defensa]ASX26640.1 3-deoxy-D-manno-octulosonic acid transferase [Candidatus Hamiltonella defensa (Bemisia tabaci)]CED78338.1 3-deoxy-D-manno-octulosonic acid transferase [Candidatus Hamiltonella defensa (Bemisia tabaci)]
MWLKLYQGLFYLIQPIIWIRLLLRARFTPAYRKRWSERYGFCKKKVTPGGLVIHSVSVGETIAAIPLVKALQQAYPSLPITMTTMTPTGSERILSDLGSQVHHVYLPYDLPCAIHRFLDTLNPKLFIILETELWPTLITVLYQKKIPLIIANARLSERSAAGYQKIAPLMKSLLERLTLVAVQNEEDGKRFIQLGLKPSQIVVTGSIKFDIHLTPELKMKAVSLRKQWAPDRLIWIASSTHEGEETLLLEAQRQLLQKHPDLLLILVPRHPERFSKVANLVKKSHFNYIKRSSGDFPSSTVQVIIGDTMGELMLLYGIADLAFVGGSLVNHGGHNPLEPAAQGVPIMMGPHTFNFKDICTKLVLAQGLIQIPDVASLVKTVDLWLIDQNCRHEYGQNAMEVFHQNQGALKHLLSLLKPYLPEMPRDSHR